MNTENINIILEQKNLILKDIYNLSKKIEVYVKQENPDLIALIDKRKPLLERALKCDPAIKNLINNEESGLSEQEKERLEKIISGNVESLELSEEEQEIYDKIKENTAIIKKITTLNNSIDRMVKNEYEKTKKQLSEKSKANANDNMFR